MRAVNRGVAGRWRIITLALACLGVVACDNGQRPCRVDYDVGSAWQGGFIGHVVIHNLGERDLNRKRGWQLDFADTADQEIVNIWNASAATKSGRVEIVNAPWNRVIPAGGSVDFGFEAHHEGPDGFHPESFRLNGRACGPPEPTPIASPDASAIPAPPTPTASPEVTAVPTPIPTPSPSPSTSPDPEPTPTPTTETPLPPVSPSPSASPSPTPTSQPASTPPPVATPYELSGRELYELHSCNVCHGSDGAGTTIAPTLLTWREALPLANQIDSAMPLGNAVACTGDCAQKIASFILDDLVGDVPLLSCAQGPTALPRRLRPLTRREYVATVKDLLGLETTVPLTDFPAEIRIDGYDNMVDSAEMTARHVDAYLVEAESLATRAIAERKDHLLPCNPAGGAASCARTFLEDFGKRAYRRPLDDAEVATLISFFPQDDALFDVGLHDAIWAMLLSPHFLYRSELGNPGEEGAFQLDDWEVASALSYLIIGSMPDEDLFAAAAEGRLSTPSERRAAATRLLDSPRAREHVGLFAAQWLGADPLLAGQKSASAFPRFDETVQEKQFQELREFLAYVTFDSTGRFEELLDSPTVLVDPSLADYYGLPQPPNDVFSPVFVADGSRGGLLTLGSVLSAHAHSTDTSPIKRGVFVRRRLLCQDLPPPPPDVDNTPPGLDPSLSTRERFAAHSASQACQSCHQFIDGIGFGFLHFDGAGARIESEGGHPVDASGELRGLASLEDTTTIPFYGAQELGSLLATSDTAQRCLAEQLYRWSRGVAEADSLTCEIDILGDAFGATGGNLRSLWLDLVELPSFTRRSETEEVN